MFAYIKAFIAGLLSILVFHQGLVWGLDRLGMITATAWNPAPTPELGIPVIVSLALWGAVWGLVLWLLIRRAEAAGYYVGAMILGAILPTVLAFALVPLAEEVSYASLFAHLTLASVGLAAGLNAVYGLGFALLMRLMHPPR